MNKRVHQIDTPEVSQNITNHQRVGIIVINWNAYATTRSCISSLLDWGNRWKIYIVDNGSILNEAVKLESDFPQCSIIRANRNLGYGGANNLGIKQAIRDNCCHVLLLNNDAMISESSASLLLETINQYEDIAVVGPVITDETCQKVLNAGGRDIAKNSITHLKEIKDKEKCYIVEYVSGTVALFQIDYLYQSGGLDEKYFFSGEIADYCRKIKSFPGRARTAICPSAFASHKPGLAGTARRSVYVYYTVRNRYLYLRKHHTYRFDLYATWVFHHIVHAWRARFRFRDGSARWVLTGLKDGLIGNYGPHESVSS